MLEYRTPEEGEQPTTGLADSLARLCEINILSHLSLHTIVWDQDRLVAALWFGTSGNDVDFNVCVKPGYRGFGTCTKLVRSALREYQVYQEAGYQLRLEVVNHNLVEMLLREGLGIYEESHDRTIMTQGG